MKQHIWIFCCIMVSIAISVQAQDSIGIFDGSTDIGEVGFEGFVTFDEDNNLYTIDTTSAGLDDFEDSFTFVYKELSGNFVIEGLPLPFAGGRGGLMIRQNLETGSPFAALMRESDEDIFPQFRTLPNEATSDDGEFTSDDDLLDGTIRLERIGNSIHFYTLNLDEEWELQQTEVFELHDPVYVGLAATAGDNAAPELFDFMAVSIEEYSFSVYRDFGAEEPAPGDQLEITLSASSADVSNATVTEVIPDGAIVSNISADTGVTVETEDGSIEWSLAEFSGEAALTYTVDLPNRPMIIWRGTYTDGEPTIDETGLRSGYIGGDMFVAESLSMQPRESLSVHPEVPRFIEAEWGHLTGEERSFGLHMFPESDSGIVLHAADASSGSILDSILEFNLDVQESGTYYFFGQFRREDSQSDSFYGGFDVVEASDDFGFPIGGGKNLDRRWWQTFNEGERFWSRTGELRAFELSTGEHTFLISPRESNANIDWFVITSDPTINIGNFIPREQFYTISRTLPSTGSDLPDPVSVSLELGVVQGNNLDFLVEEQFPEGWSVSEINAGIGSTEVVENTIVWTVTGVNEDTELTYTLTPPADVTYGLFDGNIENQNTGETQSISGDTKVPEVIPFQIRTEPIDVAPDEITFIQAEAPHEVTGDFVVDGDLSLVSGLYAMPTSSGRSGGTMEDQELTFELNVLEDGTYYIFANTRSESNQTDSFYIGFDVEFPGLSTGSENDHFAYAVSGEGEFERAWQLLFEEGERFWNTLDEPRPHELTAGLHTLNWHSREQQAKVDWIAITTDPTLDIDAVLEPGQDTSVNNFMLY